ncbi:MAG: hypothetical protein KUG65_06985 [Sphingomonadaceae bacterium]|nr:hypothetical protein [Sphingomonadaceae bacterium]
MQTAILAMAISSIALLIFTSASLSTFFYNEKFWTTVAVTGLGGFLGTILFGKSRDESQ